MNYNLGRARGLVDIDTKGLKEADISLREAGRGLLYTGTAILGGFGYIAKVAADFEKEMDFVQAITQASTDEMDKLTEAAIELGKRGPYGPREVAGAFVELAKAGIDANQIVAGMGEAAVDLASAADIGLVESTEILVNTMKTFGLEAEDAKYIVDQIAGAANASTIDVDDFAYSLRYAGSIAAAVQLPLEDVATALAILGDRGIKGSTGGTSLRRILLNLQPASEKAATALEDLGIITEDGTNRFFTAEGSAKSLAEVFQILSDATADLTDAEKLQAFNTIFGARAAPSALILTEQAAAGFEQYAEAIERTTAADVAAERLDNLTGAVQRLKAALEATFIQTGTPFQAVLTDIVNGVRELVLWFGKLPQPVQSFIVGGIAVIGILSLLSGAFLLTIGNIVRAVRVIGQLAGLFGLLGSGGAAGKAAGGVGLLGRSLGFLLSPLGLIVLAIAAAVGAFIYFYKTNEKFRDFINSIPGKIVDAWNAIVDFFKGPFIDGIKSAWEAVKGFFGDIGGFFGDIGGGIGRAASSIGGFFSDVFGSIAGVGSGVFGGITDFFGALGNIDIGKSFSLAWDVVSNFVSELPGRLAGAASTAVSGFVGFISELPGKLGYALGFAIGRAIRFGIDLTLLFVQTGIKIVQTTIEWGHRLLVAVGQFLIDITVKVAAWVLDMGAKALEMGVTFLTNIVTWISQLPGKFVEFLTGVVGKIIEWAPQIASQGFELGLGFLNAVIDFVMQLPGKIAGFLSEVVGTIISFIPTVLSEAINFGQNLVDGVIDTITGLPGLVWNIINNVIDEFKGMVGSAFNAAKDFGSGLWEGFKDGLGISSPSYIERALFAIDGAAFQTSANLSKAVRSINDQARKLPDLHQNSTQNTARKPLTAINGPATVGTGADRQWDGKGIFIENMTIRVHIDDFNGGASTEDATRLSRTLASETKKQLEATGKKLVSRGSSFSLTPPGS